MACPLEILFISFKNKFVNVSKQLSGKLMLAKRIDNVHKDKTEEKKLEKKEKEFKIIKEKTKKVEEKLRKGGKLTTEDIIAMQGEKDE